MSDAWDGVKERRWRELEEERSRLTQHWERAARYLASFNAEKHEIEARLPIISQQIEMLKKEYDWVERRRDTIERDLSELTPEKELQDALAAQARARELEEQRRHHKTVYTPLPRAVDPYLLEAKPCPTCGTQPSRLLWTHRVDVHGEGERSFTTSGWETDCPDCGEKVEDFVESAP